MKRLSYIVLFAVLFTGCRATTDTPQTIQELSQKLSDRLSNIEGTFAVAFQDLQNPEKRLLINGNERFHAASTMKTPVLIEIYRQAENGKFSVEDSILIKNTFRSIVDSSEYTMDVSEDSEHELYRNLGKKVQIYDLAYAMTTRSSNLATNILIEFVGAENVTQTMRKMGADSIEVLRGVEDIKAYEAGLSNTTTAQDLLTMYHKIGTHELLSDSSHEAIINILKDQQFNDMFPLHLPEDAEVAHKTGWITGVHHDSGIIYLPDGKAFVLVFLSKGAPNREEVLVAAADIAKWCYDFMEGS